MVKTLLLFFVITYSFAKINTASFTADFNQSVTNDQNKTLHYTGKVYYLYPDKIRWVYETPVKKEIIVKNRTVTVIEPELEQALIKKIKDEIQLQKILKEAKQISKDGYKAEVDKKEFYITAPNGVLKSIRYKDELSNEVVIRFLNLKIDSDINESQFEVKIPQDFDLIYE